LSISRHAIWGEMRKEAETMNEKLKKEEKKKLEE
jgi:hypothetical protein